MVRGKTFLLGAALVVALAAAYSPSLRGDFLWDDDLHITANPTIIGPLGLKEIWTTARANYFPLVLTNFWAQHALWDLNPLGYRVVTLLFHATAAVLLWRVLLALRVPGAWLGAALWALHPVQVESVAWICELKNTQSAVFFLAAILFWLRWLKSDRSRAPFWLSLGCALLAILSKPSTVMLPVVLGLCAWWVEGRWPRRHLTALIPFFALSAAAAGWTIWEQKIHSGASGAEWSQGLPERIALAGRVIWFYLGKLAWPEPLIFIYPRWHIDPTQPLAYAGTVAVAAGFWLAGRRGTPALRPVLLAAAVFVALLFPVLGFFDVFFFRYSFVGDHFQYLASMAPLALAGAALTRGWPRVAPAIGAVMLVALGLATARQSFNYRNNETLWRHTVARNPEAFMAWMNLADTLGRAGRHGEAIPAFRRALQLRPDDPPAWNDLGCELTLTQRADEAIGHFERALSLKPAYPEAHNNLGNALHQVGRREEALAHYRRAVELKPDYAEAHNNLGAELAEAGRFDEAVAHFQTALRLAPGKAATHAGLARALAAGGRPAEALPHFEAAWRLAPESAEARLNLGTALARSGRNDEAIAHFESAVRIAPRLAAARTNLATALGAASRWREAVAHFQAAAELQPENAAAQARLSVALVNDQQLSAAVPAFEAALRLDPNAAEVHDNFAQLLRALGRTREAFEHFETAADLRRAAAR